jgi:hypothetical protein
MFGVFSVTGGWLSVALLGADHRNRHQQNTGA